MTLGRCAVVVQPHMKRPEPTRHRDGFNFDNSVLTHSFYFCNHYEERKFRTWRASAEFLCIGLAEMSLRSNMCLAFNQI